MPNKINLFLTMLAQFVKMSDSQTEEFIKNMTFSLVTHILTSGVDLVSPEILTRLSAISSSSSVDEIQSLLNDYMTSLGSTPEGQSKLDEVYVNLIDTVITPVENDLSNDQKTQLLAILQSPHLS